MDSVVQNGSCRHFELKNHAKSWHDIWWLSIENRYIWRRAADPNTNGGTTVEDIRLPFAYTNPVFDPDAALPRINRTLVYLGACIIAGLRLARERQVNTSVIPTRHAIEESVDLAHEIFNRVFRKIPERVEGK